MKMVCIKKGAWHFPESNTVFPYAAPNYGEIVTVTGQKQSQGRTHLYLAEYQVKVPQKDDVFAYGAMNFRPIIPDEPKADEVFDFRKKMRGKVRAV